MLYALSLLRQNYVNKTKDFFLCSHLILGAIPQRFFICVFSALVWSPRTIKRSEFQTLWLVSHVHVPDIKTPLTNAFSCQAGGCSCRFPLKMSCPWV